MSRGAESQAKQTYNSDKALTADSEGKSGDLYNTLTPYYKNEMTNPQGFDPHDLADMNTAGQESVGGALASDVGQSALMGARNHNLGSFGESLDDSAREGMKTNSANALKIAEDNAKLKEAHRAEGVAGAGSLYGTENQDVLSSLGLQTGATNALTDAGKSGWFQNMTGLISSLGTAAGGAGQLLTGASKVCWVAAELYGGWDSQKTQAIRKYISEDWKTPAGRVFLLLYSRFGKLLASFIRRSYIARSVVKKAFDKIYLNSLKVK